MADPYKPEEAVMLIVWTSGGAHIHSTLNNTIEPINAKQLDYITTNLSARHIPWDNTTASNDDISGFGHLVISNDELIEKVAAKVWTHLLESHVVKNPDGTPSQDTAGHFVEFINSDLHALKNKE